MRQGRDCKHRGRQLPGQPEPDSRPGTIVIQTDSPYLSVVVTTRNDDHGGDPLKRLQAFINTFDEQTRRTGLSAEVIVVEWNPPADRARIHELVTVPDRCPFRIRFIEVPSVLHDRIRFGEVLPLFQMIGKNVGIRRANGRFVLSTNIDIIFSNQLVEYLASGQLAPDFIIVSTATISSLIFQSPRRSTSSSGIARRTSCGSIRVSAHTPSRQMEPSRL